MGRFDGDIGRRAVRDVDLAKSDAPVHIEGLGFTSLDEKAGRKPNRLDNPTDENTFRAQPDSRAHVSNALTPSAR